MSNIHSKKWFQNQKFAMKWFKQGRLYEIAEYCCYDVKLTKLVHEYGMRHRQLHYRNKFNKKLTVPVKW